ncbi:MAG: TRAP transporter small permease subunit [Candidatus Odyssella sp.]|nr:TRAP transporter small permease subunit [Candidatus Odyssella sp.]
MTGSRSQALGAAGRWLDPVLTLADRVGLRAVWIGGALLLASASLVSIDVTIRKLFGLSVGGADEISGYAFAIGVAWAFPFALLRRANVRIDALYQHMPARVAAILDLVALIALAVFVTVLTRYAWEVVAGSWNLGALSNSQLKMPLWIPQGLWFLGLALFFATTAVLTLRTALALLSGDLATVRALAGARSIEEEAADEAAYGKTLAAGASETRAP